VASGDHIVFAGGTFSNNSSFLGSSLPDDGSDGVAFFASMDTACTDIEWIQVLGSSALSYINDLESTESGDLLLVGAFADSLFLPDDTLTGTTGAEHLFYLRSDSTGTIEWATSLDADISWNYITLASDGSFYLAFKFTGSFTLPTATITADNP
jgi:hypothetical protein